MTVPTRALVVTLACVAFALAARTIAQTQGRDARTAVSTAATASITGVVTTGDEANAPLKRVTVALASGSLQVPYIALTNDAGVFTFGGVPAGAYTLSATKPAYVPAFYGAKRPGRGPGVPIAILEGQKLTGISLRMLRGGVITGTLLQPSGIPAVGVNVQLSEVPAASERKALSLIEPVRTDDRGVFRFYGLAPGRYTVRARPAGTASSTEARLMAAEEIQWAQRAAAAPGAPLPPVPAVGATVGLAPVYYPGTPEEASAGSVSIAPGEERAGVDFVLLRVPTARVSGVVFAPDGTPLAGAQVSLPVNNSDSPSDLAMSMFSDLAGGSDSRTDASGAFTLRGVAPGRYKITVRATPRQGAATPPAGNEAFMMMGGMFGGSSSAVWWAEDEIVVDGRDLADFRLRLQPGMTVSGKVVFDVPAGTTAPEVSKVRVALGGSAERSNPFAQMMSSMLGGSGATVAADGTFAVKGLIPDRYRATTTMPGVSGGWVLKSAMLDGVDIADVPLDVRAGRDLAGVVVTLTNRVSEFSGTVIDQAGRATGGFPIVVFASDRAQWTAGSRRVKQARPSSDGRFSLSGLPAGEYYVAAVTDLEPGDLADPAFLEQLAAAAFKITLADGEKKQQDVKLGGG